MSSETVPWQWLALTVAGSQLPTNQADLQEYVDWLKRSRIDALTELKLVNEDLARARAERDEARAIAEHLADDSGYETYITWERAK